MLERRTRQQEAEITKLRAEVSLWREKAACPPHLPHMGMILRSFSEPGARRPHSAAAGHAPHHPLSQTSELGGLEGRSDVASDGPKRKAVSSCHA